MKYQLSLGVASLALAATLPEPAPAQDTAVLQEVIVTAQRREENLQKVPVSVTVFDTEQLARGNITKASEYLALTPNASFSEDANYGARGINIGIRGVTDIKSGVNSVINSIGIYLDEFSIVANPVGTINPRLQDMERVEILRGPQGTYFGRNSIGGALNLTTKNPSENFEGGIAVGNERYGGDGSQTNVDLTFNAPISDTFRTRTLLSYEDNSGFVKNINPNGVDSGHEYLTGRVTALWTPSDSTSLRFTGIYSHEDQKGDDTVPTGVWNVDTVDGYRLGVSNLTEAVDPEGIGFFPNNQNRSSRDLNEKVDTRTLIGIVNVTHEISEGLTLKWISGYLDGTGNRLFDEDEVGQWDNFFRMEDRDGYSYSTELRVERTGGTVDWVAGALYARDSSHIDLNVVAGTQTDAPIGPLGPDPSGVVLLPPLPFGLCFSCTQKDFDVESLSAFVDATWHVSQKFSLIAGGRYTRDDVDTRLAQLGPIFPDISVTAVAAGSQSFNDFSPRVSARYEFTDDASVYAVVSRGYKAGGTSLGFNADPVNVPLPPVIATPFREETLTNYEVGFKTEWLDHRLRLNAAAFLVDWDDLQLEVFRFLVPGNLQSKFALTANIDSARSKGVELELAAAITSRFSLYGGVGVLDTEITKSGPQELSGGFIVNLEGLDIPKSPPLTANLIGEYRWPLAGDGEGWVRSEFVHRDGQYSDVEALVWRQTRGQFPPNGGGAAFLPPTVDGFPFKTPNYDVVNLRGGFSRGPFAFSVAVENVFDEKYYTGTAENFGVSGIRVRPHPRVYGAELRYNFGGGN